MSRRELGERIRFALQQLSARNAHHEFEHICRNVARLRICSNILPATGPVTSGGDQGRDFETFRTYLASNVRSASTFVGLAADKPVAFGCTLQVKNLKKKIKGDLKTIAAGEPCDSVHYFLGVDFAVAKRHELQKDVRTAHSIHLEIYDAAALTEFLSERELFWIANEYLSIPADAYPTDEDVDDWYSALRTEWSAPANRHVTYASFQRVKRAIRSLVTHAERQSDVALWIECLRLFRDGEDPRLADMARYEIAVASERIKSSMSGLEDDIRGFFNRALASSDPTRLIDVNCLLLYTTVANRRGTTQVTVDELKEVRSRLQQKAKQLLDEAESPTEQCVALDLVANVHVAPEPGSRTSPDPASAFQAWNKIVDLVDRAPLFPLQELSDRLVQWLPFLVERPEYEPLVAKLDAAVAHRTGRFAAANNCSARARSLAEQGRLVQAIRELNRAKIDWFSNETLNLALKSVLLIARAYSSLGLLFAAKYYALAVAYMGLPSDDQTLKPLIARGFFLAAECDYSSGAWLQALSLLRAGQVAQSHYVGKDLEDDDADLRRVLLYGAYIYGVSEKASPAIRSKVVELTQDWPDLDVLKATATNAVNAFIEECADGGEARTQFFRAPFSECEETQAFEWSALGLEWSVTWKTGRDLNLAAEQFLAVAQIVTCDLARSDLYIVPSRVRVEIVAGSTKTHVDAERLHDNTMSNWRVTIPPGPPTANRHIEDVAVVAQILHEQSLRSTEWPVFEALGKEGLFQNTMIGTHYSTVYSAVNPVPVLTVPAEADARFAALTWRRQTDEALGWNARLVEEYKPAQVQELLERRYTLGLKKCQLSLKRLLADAPSRATLIGLRADGWLDWQLLSAISGVALAWRVPAKGLRLDQEAGMNEAVRMMNSPEEQPDWQEVPLAEFSKEALERQLEVNMMSSVQGMGLRSRQFTPNFAGLKTFARTKLRLFSDDVAHPDPLEASQSSG